MEVDEEVTIAIIAACSAALLAAKPATPTKRVHVQGYAHSMLAKDEKNFQRIFRVSRSLFTYVVEALRLKIEYRYVSHPFNL
jgi:hypothetical protein